MENDLGVKLLVRIIHEKHPMSGNLLFEPQMLNEISIILIASKEQQEAEQDYLQNPN